MWAVVTTNIKIFELPKSDMTLVCVTFCLYEKKIWTNPENVKSFNIGGHDRKQIMQVANRLEQFHNASGKLLRDRPSPVLIENCYEIHRNLINNEYATMMITLFPDRTQVMLFCKV